MTTDQMFVAVIMAAALLAAMPAFRGMWRGGDALAKVERLWRRIWPYSESALQAWLRAQMAVYLGGCSLTLAYPALVLMRTSDGSTSPILSVVAWTGVTGFVTMIAFVISIVMFNVPKRLVIPSLRNQEGLLVRWWRRRSRSPEP
jgi:hypothetical protein